MKLSANQLYKVTDTNGVLVLMFLVSCFVENTQANCLSLLGILPFNCICSGNKLLSPPLLHRCTWIFLEFSVFCSCSLKKWVTLIRTWSNLFNHRSVLSTYKRPHSLQKERRGRNVELMDDRYGHNALSLAHS